MLPTKGWLVGLMGALLLTGCASSDNKELIKPLPELTENMDIKRQWRTNTGAGIGDYWSSLSPELRYNKLFVAERFGLVSALDPSNGKTLWRTNLRREFADGMLTKNDGARLSGGIATGFDKVFVGSENGVLFALSAEDGKVLWQVDTAGEVLSDPAVVGTYVLVNTSAGKIQAFDVDDGQFQWQADLTMPSLALRGTSSIATSQGAAFVGTPDGKVLALFGDNGAPIWEAQIAEATGSNELQRVVDVDAKPLVIGNNLYAISFNGALASIELRSGRVLWNRTYSSFSSPISVGLDLYFSDASSVVYAIDRRNGLEKWANRELEGRKLTEPQVIGRYIVVGDYEGYLHVMERSSGQLVGQFLVDKSGLYTQPVRDGNTLYLQSRDGDVTAVTIP